MAAFDTVWRNARLATLAPGLPGLGIVACRDGRIAYAGSEAGLPAGGGTGRSIATGAGSRPDQSVAGALPRLAAGVMREGTRTLGRLAEAGPLEPGKWCDLAIRDVGEVAELVYRTGFNPLHRRVWHGR